MTMARPPTIVLFASGFPMGEQRATNLGDAAQQLRALQLLREAFPGYGVVAWANSPEDAPLPGTPRFSRELAAFLRSAADGRARRRLLVASRALRLLGGAALHRLRAPVPAWLGGGVIDELAGSAFVLFSGAGALNQRYLRSVGGLWLLAIALARIVGVPVVLLGQQVGPFSSAPLRALAGRVLRKVAFLGCRDDESLTVCRAMAIPRAVCRFTGDEGAYLAPAPQADALRLLAAHGLAPGFFAVQLRFDANSPFEPHLAWFARVVDGVARRLDAQVALVPMAYRGAADDRAAAARLLPLLAAPAVRLECDDPALVKACLGHAAAALGVANHFVVFAASMGVPSAGVYATEYMRQKLQGAQRRMDGVVAVAAEQAPAEALAQRIAAMARDPGRCRGPARFTAVPPQGYWGWVARTRGKAVHDDAA